jgi:hypothetical protein
MRNVVGAPRAVLDSMCSRSSLVEFPLHRCFASHHPSVSHLHRTSTSSDPTDCKHSDIEKDLKELRKVAFRINHRRIALRQQQMWIDSAKEGLAKIEAEIKTTTDTAGNLAEQLDALTAQKEDITNHVKRAILLKELDQTSSNLMRLKNARMEEEVSLQKKHNNFAIKNHEHNQVLDKLAKMRQIKGLALGKIDDPKPYRFAQAGLDAAAAETNVEAAAPAMVETESDADAQAEQDSAEEGQ